MGKKQYNKTKDKAADPVHIDWDDDKWYFWDETWATRYGPYDSETAARRALKYYGRTELR